MEETTVIFRTFKDGSGVIALFPYDIQDTHGSCQSYMHIGQHGSADYNAVISITKPSTNGGIEPLKKTLISLGYTNLKVIKRAQGKRVSQAILEFRQRQHNLLHNVK